MKRYYVVILLLISSCQPDDDDSALKHQLGVLKRERNDPNQFEQCTQDSTQAHEGGTLSKMQAVVSSYLRDLSQEIMIRVDQSLLDEGRDPVFVENYAKEKFCYHVPKKINKEINAAAFPTKRILTFNLYTFLALTEESALASIMCHEIAHITMAHNDTHGLPMNIYHKIFTNEDMTKRYEQARESCERARIFIPSEELTWVLFKDDSAMKSKIDRIRNDYKLFFTSHFLRFVFGEARRNVPMATYTCRTKSQMYQILKDKIKDDQIAKIEDEEIRKEAKIILEGIKELQSRNVINESDHHEFSFIDTISSQLDQAFQSQPNGYVNWQEQEADEVGYEMCIRAGVDLTNWDAYIRKIMLKKGDHELVQCLKEINTGVVPSRGVSSHPSSCWRIFNFVGRENLSHADDFKRLQKAHGIRPLLDHSRLQETIDMIKQYQIEQEGT